MQNNDKYKQRKQKLLFVLICGLFIYLINNVSANYESSQTIELTSEQFLNKVFESINNERSFKGFLPLIKDDTAIKLAGEQSDDLIKKGCISYYNLNNKSPDERYTLSGGTGALIEIVKGFEIEKSKDKIKLTELLAHYLVEAIVSSQDDSKVLFSPYITHFGCGFSTSKDERKFVSINEFVTKGGEFDPIKPAINIGEKIKISGRIKNPYKFKAVSIAYLEELKSKDDEQDCISLGFSEDDINPYFPPQDYIAFSDTSKSNFIKVLKGIGLISAIGASPFTGGASAILAPVLLTSLQNGQPKEIPLKRGIKANSKGEFSGEIDLNYQGRAGLYYVSILAELASVNFPIVVSRRTVRVNSILPNGES